MCSSICAPNNYVNTARSFFLRRIIGLLIEKTQARPRYYSLTLITINIWLHNWAQVTFGILAYPHNPQLFEKVHFCFNHNWSAVVWSYNGPPNHRSQCQDNVGHPLDLVLEHGVMSSSTCFLRVSVTYQCWTRNWSCTWQGRSCQHQPISWRWHCQWWCYNRPW